MYEIKVFVKDIMFRRFSHLSTNHKRVITTLMTTIAVKRFENLVRKRVVSGIYQAYQIEKTNRSDAGWETHMIIKKDSTFLRVLYKPIKNINIRNIKRKFSEIKTENEELGKEIRGYIPTLGKLKNFLSQDEMNGLPKPVRKLLLSKRNEK